MEFMKIEQNVLDFALKTAKIVGNHKADSFDRDVWSEWHDLEIKSPIEQILYCAMKAVMEVNYIDRNEPSEINGKMFIFGLGIYPQYKIENYRVDFLVGFYSRDGKNNEQIRKEIIVECDSQIFHERTEQERRYEKERDRYLQMKGYKIFHFTGSEIVKNAINISCEIISSVTNYSKEDLIGCYENIIQDV